MERHWDSLPRTGDSAAPLVAMPEGNYTTYQWPLPLSDTTVLVLKTDYDRPSRFVRLDTRTGAEEPVCYTGLVSTRPAMYGGRVWWTEYRRSKLFEQRVNSQLCYMDLERGTARTFVGRRNALYPTPAPGELAWVEYNPDGTYTVVVQRDGQPERRFGTPRHTEIHGLAWDDVTLAYYVIVTDARACGSDASTRRGVPPHRGGLYHTEQPQGGRREALLRLDLIGQGRSPLLRPYGPPRIPHHHVGLRFVFPGAVARRRGRRRGVADHV